MRTVYEKRDARRSWLRQHGQHCCGGRGGLESGTASRAKSFTKLGFPAQGGISSRRALKKMRMEGSTFSRGRSKRRPGMGKRDGESRSGDLTLTPTSGSLRIWRKNSRAAAGSRLAWAFGDEHSQELRALWATHTDHSLSVSMARDHRPERSDRARRWRL